MLGRTIAAGMLIAAGCIYSAVAGEVVREVDLGRATIPSPLAATTPGINQPPPASYRTVYRVQVGASRTWNRARQALQELQQSHPKLLGNLSIEVERADLKSKGIWYRMQIGAFGSSSEAEGLCRELALLGLSDCLVVKRRSRTQGKSSSRRRLPHAAG